MFSEVSIMLGHVIMETGNNTATWCWIKISEG